MVLTLDPQLMNALQERATQRGISAEQLALDALRQHFLPKGDRVTPQDDWERQLLALAKDCGVSLSDANLSREAIYE